MKRKGKIYENYSFIWILRRFVNVFAWGECLFDGYWWPVPTNKAFIWVDQTFRLLWPVWTKCLLRSRAASFQTVEFEAEQKVISPYLSVWGKKIDRALYLIRKSRRNVFDRLFRSSTLSWQLLREFPPSATDSKFGQCLRQESNFGAKASQFMIW